MARIDEIINLRNPLNISNPFQQNGVSAGVIPGTVQYQQENPQKTTLQQAYEQAMSKTTPSWVTALSNAMPAIAQIGALGATKGAFNQGYVADSLEREKQRQLAYNQAKQQQEQNKVKDFVQMAKDQMGIDRADENTAYTREQARLKSAYDKMIADREWENKQDLQEQAKEQWKAEQAIRKQLADLKEKEILANRNKPAELTPEEKIVYEIKKEEALANAKNKREKEKAKEMGIESALNKIEALEQAMGFNQSSDSPFVKVLKTATLLPLNNNVSDLTRLAPLAQAYADKENKDENIKAVLSKYGIKEGMSVKDLNNQIAYLRQNQLNELEKYGYKVLKGKGEDAGKLAIFDNNGNLVKEILY